MRTYAGHSSAAASNALYRRNLDKGPDGPLGRFRPADPDRLRPGPRPRARRGRQGRVPISHIGDMRALFDQIPLAQMNTSMTINATAMWLLAMYQVAAEEQGADIADLAGTTQNDIIRNHLSRGTYVSRPAPRCG